LASESSVAVGDKAVWVLDAGSPTQLVTVDPRTNRVVRTVPAPTGAVALRAGFGALWATVGGPSGALARLDPTTGKVLATVPVGPGSSFLALGAGSVWGLNQDDGTVARVDAASNRVVATIKVSDQAVDGGDIAASDQAVWARVSDVLAVKIDPTNNRVVQRVGDAEGSGSVAIDGDAVWISAHDVTSIWRVPAGLS
jgi:glutamine cyclotransferase